jgi:hypothetical protein
MTIDYIKYYDLEKYILTDLRKNFDLNKHLTAFDFFCIVIWKANRAKTKVAERLIKYNKEKDIEKSVYDLTSKIYLAKDDKQKLKVLIEDYKFRLPMSSAILSMLYPDNFTIYDVRVCDTLTDFKGLDNISNFENLWNGYSKYIDSVKKYKPQNLSLRDKDRFLWGKSFYEQLTDDLKKNFKKNEPTKK